MRILWFTLLVLVVCSPLALVALLVAETFLPALDRLTMHEPLSIRTSVAEIAMGKVGFGKDADARIQRVLRLDPANADARTRVCQKAANAEQPGAEALCRAALATEPSAMNYNALGRIQEAAGDPCSAEDSYTLANSKENGQSSFYLRNMGVAAYKCGRVAYAIAELGAAEDLDQKAIQDPSNDTDDADEDKDDLRTDREWLSVAYAASKQPKLAAEASAKAHPEWKNCACAYTGGKVACADTSPK